MHKLYDEFYRSTTPGALIVVAGYPQLFEDPATSWAKVNALTRRCQGVHYDDAEMLRGIAGRLNQAIGAEVKAAATRHPDRTWVFADVSVRFADHGLCSKEAAQWINGLTSGLGAVDFRLQRSFHPTQKGHTDGYANFIAQNKKVREWRPVGAPAVSVTGEMVDCTIDCQITGRVDFEHPQWGPSSLVTLKSGHDTCGPARLAVVDVRGAVKWRHHLGDCFSYVRPGSPATDKTGHLFIDWNPGRYNGVAVLQPAPHGFEDFRTLPTASNYVARFYYAQTADKEGDGTLEIAASSNDCVPHCAGGTIAVTTYRWSGRDYEVDPKETVRCGEIHGDLASEDIAADITARGASCAEAFELVERVSDDHNFYSGPRRFTSGRFQCTVKTVDDGLPTGHYACNAGDARVTWKQT